MMHSLQSAFGLLVFVAIAWAISEDRRAASVRVAVAGIAAQLILAALLLKLPPLASGLAALNDLALTLQQATDAGTSFVFGYLGGGPLPFEETHPQRKVSTTVVRRCLETGEGVFSQDAQEGDLGAPSRR